MLLKSGYAWNTTLYNFLATFGFRRYEYSTALIIRVIQRVFCGGADEKMLNSLEEELSKI